MKDILTSPRMEDIKRKRRRRRLRLSILFSILFVSIVIGIGYLSSNPRITINKINITGTRIINASDVEKRVEGLISGKYIYLFAKKNILIYPRSRVYQSLLKDFPRISSLSIRREKWNTLNIDITERAGSYLYCGSAVPEVESEVGENCYFINNDGYIFDKAPYFSGNVYFKYYIKIDDISDPLGKQMLSPSNFHQLVRFVDGINSLGFHPIYMVVNANNSFLYLDHGVISTSPQIIFNNDNNLQDILTNLSLSMAKPEFANEIHSKYDTLLYIDLRFKNKVLYKFE